MFLQVFKLTLKNKYLAYCYYHCLGIYQVNLNPGVKKPVPKVCSLSSACRLSQLLVYATQVSSPCFIYGDACVQPRMF